MKLYCFSSSTFCWSPALGSTELEGFYFAKWCWRLAYLARHFSYYEKHSIEIFKVIIDLIKRTVSIAILNLMTLTPVQPKLVLSRIGENGEAIVQWSRYTVLKLHINSPVTIVTFACLFLISWNMTLVKLSVPSLPDLHFTDVRKYSFVWFWSTKEYRKKFLYIIYLFFSTLKFSKLKNYIFKYL